MASEVKTASKRRKVDDFMVGADDRYSRRTNCLGVIRLFDKSDRTSAGSPAALSVG
jgi:hypothetical protein